MHLLVIANPVIMASFHRLPFLVWNVFLILALSSFVSSEKLKIGLIHYSDILGQYEPFKMDNSTLVSCPSRETPGCRGGIAQLMGHIESIENRDFSHLPSSSKLVLCPGNYLSGKNGWLANLGGDRGQDNAWDALGRTLRVNWLGTYDERSYFRPNFTSLGVSDFEGGLPNLVTFLEAASSLGVRGTDPFRPVISNMNCAKDYGEGCKDENRFCEFVDSHQTLMGGRIGFVGFLDPLVFHKTEPGNLEFTLTISSLKGIADHELSGASAVIAMGTGSLSFAMKILDEIPKIKFVLLGGTGNNVVGEEYPQRYNGSWILRSSRYGVNLGKLEFELDTVSGSTDIIRDNSRLIRNDDIVPFNREAEKLIGNLAKKVADVGFKDVALLKARLVGSPEFCQNGECDLGNLIADGMVACAYKNLSYLAPSPLIALWHGGGFQGLDFEKNTMLSVSDVRKFLPYANNLTLVTVNGSILLQIFGTSATGLGGKIGAVPLPILPNPDWGQFLQVSAGIRVTYGIKLLTDNTSSTYLKNLMVLNSDEIYEEVTPSSALDYHLLLPSFLYNGRSAYHFLPGSFAKVGPIDSIEIGKDYICLQNYVESLGVLYNLQERRGRIQIEIEEEENNFTTEITTTAETEPVTTEEATEITLISTSEEMTSGPTLTSTEQPRGDDTTLATTTVAMETSTSLQGADKNQGNDNFYQHPHNVDTLQLALVTSTLTTLFLVAVFTIGWISYLVVVFHLRIKETRRKEFPYYISRPDLEREKNQTPCKV